MCSRHVVMCLGHAVSHVLELEPCAGVMQPCAGVMQPCAGVMLKSTLSVRVCRTALVSKLEPQGIMLMLLKFLGDWYLGTMMD